MRGGAAVVLVVDDQPAVARAVAEMLSSAGYTVQVATDINTATAIVEREPIHLIVADVVLGASGDVLDLTERLSARQLPLLMMSGYAEPPGAGLPDDPILHKPFTAAELLERVEQALRR